MSKHNPLLSRRRPLTGPPVKAASLPRLTDDEGRDPERLQSDAPAHWSLDVEPNPAQSDRYAKAHTLRWRGLVRGHINDRDLSLARKLNAHAAMRQALIQAVNALEAAPGQLTAGDRERTIAQVWAAIFAASGA